MFMILIATALVVGSLQICVSTIPRFTPTIQSTCACPGDISIYECVTTGLGITVWMGTRFSGCPSQDNQILLSHTLFMDRAASGRCNAGSVIAEGIEIIDDQCYRSLLNITLESQFNNSDIMCVYMAINGTQRVIGSSTIHISGPPEQAAIYLMDANSTHLTFTVLSPVIPNCSRLSYSVEASSNCGSCPESTTSTAIICTNFTTSVDANITCKLTVGGIICENMPGEKASLLSITLKVPGAPFVESQPIYLQERPGILAELITSFNETDTFNISKTVDGSAINYTIIYSDSTSGRNCSPPAIISSSSCLNGICSHLFDVLSSSDCPASANITTTVFASNVLGDGAPSNPTTSDGVNNFVRVSFDSATNRLRCMFLSLPNNALKQCTANITYGTNCDQQFPNLYSNENTGEIVIIPPLELISDVAEYCFVITASSDNMTAAVRGMFFAIDTTKMNGNRTEDAASGSMIAAIIIPLLLLAAVGILVVLIVIVRLYLHNYWQILDYTIEILVKNDVQSVIEVLEVFEKLNININGFNTYLRHKEFKRQNPDLPGYSIYFVHCECSVSYRPILGDDLPQKLIPELGNTPTLANKFVVKDTNYECQESHGSIVTIKFPIKDEVGSLCRALHTLKHNEELKVVGINTSSIWGSTAQYSQNHVKFSCSRMQKKKIDSTINMKGITVKTVIVKTRGDKHSTQKEQEIELYVLNLPGNLASALCAFDELGVNITRINELQPGAEEGYRNILVKCYCGRDDREKLKRTLEKYDAQNVEISENSMDEQQCNCTVTYSVSDIKGSLLKSVKAFEECGVNIAAINPLIDEIHNIEYQKNYLVFESTDEEKVQLIERIRSINSAFIIKGVLTREHNQRRMNAARYSETSV